MKRLLKRCHSPTPRQRPEGTGVRTAPGNGDGPPTAAGAAAVRRPRGTESVSDLQIGGGRMGEEMGDTNEDMAATLGGGLTGSLFAYQAR